MKIIKKGDLDKINKILRFECRDCGCIFEADKTEFKLQDFSMNESMYVIECPSCHNKVYKNE